MKQFYTLILALSLGSLGFSQVFQSDLSSWNSGDPTDWMGSKTSISSSNVNEITLGANFGTSQAQLINTGSGHKRFTTQTVAVTGGATYELKIWVTGLAGEIRTAHYDLTNASWGSYNGYVDLATASAGSQTIVSQNVTVDATCTSTEFIISIRNTDANGMVIDSVSIAQFVNTAVPAPHTVYDLQYNTNANGDSPYLDSLTITSGVVTAVNSGNGYWIQDGNGAWTGIYVSDDTNTPSRGDSVTVEGLVQEDFGATQIEQLTSYTLEPTPSVIPTPTMVNTVDIQTQEEWEGVLINATNAVCTNTNAGFGQWVANNGTTANDSVLVDDDLYAYTPTLNTSYGITGIGHFSYGDYKILPRDIDDIVGAIPPAVVTIYDIQFTTDVNGNSPEDGNVVTTYGIVTGVTPGGRFFIQDGDGAWNGIYVYENGTTVARGDSVEVTGTVTEFNGLTEFTNVTDVTIINSGNTLPNAEVIASSSDANNEEWEGVLITVEGECTNTTEGFGLWSINSFSDEVKADDDIFAYANTAVVGNHYEVTGIGHFSFSEYKILPRDLDDIVVIGYAGVEKPSTAFEIFPNPATDNITIKGTDNAVVNIYAVNGSIAYQGIVNGQTFIDLTGLSNGLYTVEIIENNVKSNHKLIVK